MITPGRRRGRSDENRTGPAAADDGTAVDGESSDGECTTTGTRRIRTALLVVAGVAFVLAATGGFFRWQTVSHQAELVEAGQAVEAAKANTVAMLSYDSGTVQKDLGDAQSVMTEGFRETYAKLIDEVVIPGASQKNISSKASIPSAAAVSASDSTAQVLLFVDQEITFGTDPPTRSASTVRVALEKQGDRWLTSAFDPI